MLNDINVIKKLMRCFPGSFINGNIEFIAVPKTNLYFNLETCNSEFDIKCKVLEWFSRDAYKTEVYNRSSKNEEYHDYVRNGINNFLGTNFSKKDMEIIYTNLGNSVFHGLTMLFVSNDYDLSILSDV